MRQWRIVLTLCAILVALGVHSFLTMPRQEFPDFTIRQGIVVGVMPGASSKEVEERLTKPLEEYLFGFNEVEKKKTYSVSKEGQVVVYVELRPQIEGDEAPAFWAKVRHGLNELKAQKLPTEVLALIGNSDFGDTSAVLFTVVAEGRSPRDLAKYVEVLESHLRRIEATSKLRTFGAQDEVIKVSIARERLVRYGIRPAAVWAALKGFGASPTPARLDTDTLELPIRVGNALRSEGELGDTIILSLPTGQNVRLKDVAEIHREYGHDEAAVRFNGKTAMVLSIEMQSGHDITRFGEEVDGALEQTRRELPPGVTIARVADQPQVVKTSVNHFLRDFGLAVASVIAVTMLLLPLRVAVVAAVSIPVTIAITLAVLNALGVQLQTVSLAGLVVVLGMVVDNAIVVIDDHVDKLDRGLDPWTAAWKSARELMIPVLTATVAVILSYVPLPMFVAGTAGDFLRSLPVTIGVALVASMVVAMLLVPIMDSTFVRRGLRRKSGRRTMLDLLQGWFDRALEAAFRHPVLPVGVGLASIVAAGVVASGIPQQMFPKVDRNQFAVEVYLPNGRSLEQTDAVIRRLEKELLADQRVTNVTAFIGQSSPRFHTVYAPHMPARNFGQLLVNTTDDEAVVPVLREHQQRLRDAFPDAWVRWKQLELNLGIPVEVRLIGDDIATLKTVAAGVEAHARTIPGVTWVRNDFEEPLQGIEVVPDRDACARLGVPPAVLEMSLAVGSQGFPLATIWEDDYPTKVVLADSSDAARTINGLSQQYVSSTHAAAAVPLDQLASLHPTWSEGAIVRRNGVRTLTVALDVDMDALGSDVQAHMEQYLSKLDTQGLRVEFGGEKQLAEETFVPMTFSMALSISLIFLVLLFQLQRFRKVIVTMLAMPLCLLGAFLGLRIVGYPFGVTAFVGIIGLLGIVVRNGIILVTYAEDLRSGGGLGLKEAALAAGKRRMRPIYLTSMAAAIGVVPLILSRSLLWGPLGTVTCFGLLLAMVLTLFVLPVVYWLICKEEHVNRHRSAAEKPQGATAVVGLVLGVLCLACPATARSQERPISLEEARALTLKGNAEVLSSALDIEAARETRKAAHTRRFPQVSAVGLAMVAKDPLVKMDTAGGNLPVYDGNPANLPAATQFAYFPSSQMNVGEQAAVVALTAVQPLYAGGRIANGNRLAALGEEVAENKASMTRRDALAQTEEKYWRLVTLGEKRRVLAAYEALLESLERQVGAAVRGGLSTRNDQLKVAVQRQQAEIDRIRLESGIRLAARDLRRHLGLPDGDTFVPADRVSDPVDPSFMGRYRQGQLGHRPEMRLLENAVRAEHLQTALKRGEMLPTVSVGASALWTHVQGVPDSTNALLFGLVSVPLSGIWEGSYATAAQRKRELVAERNLVRTRELLALEAQRNWDELEATWRSVALAQLSVEQAEVNLKEQQVQYQSGVVTISDVLEAEVLRQQALDHRIDVHSEYWLKRSRYLRSVGMDDQSLRPGREQRP